MATLTSLEDNTGKTTSEATATGKHVLTTTLIAQKVIATIKKWNYIKLKSFYTTHETINKVKGQSEECEKNSSYSSDKGLVSRTYKELIKKTYRKTNDSIKNRKIN